MTQPLALIQGKLAQPNARLLRGLPPPYGVRREPVRPAMPRRPNQAPQDALRHVSLPAPHTWFAPGQKFRFLYKSPPPRDYSSHLDAALAEARNYLEMDRARERSSRSDHLLATVLFVACGIALAWLLAAHTAGEAGKLATATIAGPAVTARVAQVLVRPRISAGSVRPVAGLMPSVAPIADSPANLAARGRPQGELKPWLQANLPATPTLSARHTAPYVAARAPTYDQASSQAAKVNASIKAVAGSQLPAAYPKEPPASELPLSSRFTHPVVSTVVVTQPEQTARSPAVGTTVQAALRDWAVQQRRSQVTARANTNPANTNTSTNTAPNADWNAHMTQRRITDNPGAFNAPPNQN